MAQGLAGSKNVQVLTKLAEAFQYFSNVTWFIADSSLIHHWLANVLDGYVNCIYHNSNLGLELHFQKSNTVDFTFIWELDYWWGGSLSINCLYSSAVRPCVWHHLDVQNIKYSHCFTPYRKSLLPYSGYFFAGVEIFHFSWSSGIHKKLTRENLWLVSMCV